MADPPTPHPSAQTQALVHEIWMLVDYVAGDAVKGLDKIVVADPVNPGKNLTDTAVLQAVSEVEGRLGACQTALYDRASMQVVRDAFSLLVNPATGLTVAYTSMVVGPMRSPGASRASLAGAAYPNLVSLSGLHRKLSWLLILIAVLLTAFAAWESARVSFGKALLQNLDGLRTQQTLLDGEKLRYELSLKTAGANQAQPVLDVSSSPPLGSYRLCDRARIQQARMKQPLAEGAATVVTAPGASILSYSSPEEWDLCGRDDILRANLDIIHQDLSIYRSDWTSLMGGSFAFTDQTVGRTKALGGKLLNAVGLHRAPSPADTCASGHAPPCPAIDVEFRIAPMILVWGNFVLPIVFGCLGSTIFVTLDHYKKVRDNLLHPRDFFLAPVRLALGLVVGACIGLFYSSYSPAAQTSAIPNASALISSLTLSASGVAFLAGFGVETVFKMLDALITRVFSMAAEPG